MNSTNWRGAFEVAIKAAAAKAGVDISGLKWDTATIDDNWGRDVGLVFSGSEFAERAARFFAVWAQKHLYPIGSYKEQFRGDYHGEMRLTKTPSGTKWMCPRHLKDPGKYAIGYATSYVYYPCD